MKIKIVKCSGDRWYKGAIGGVYNVISYRDADTVYYVDLGLRTEGEVLKSDTEVVTDYDNINPDHYKKYSVECIDMMIAIYGKEKVATYCELAAFKYRMRMGTKPDNPIEQDLEKEKWYLNKSKELKSE